MNTRTKQATQSLGSTRALAYDTDLLIVKQTKRWGQMTQAELAILTGTITRDPRDLLLRFPSKMVKICVLKKLWAFSLGLRESTAGLLSGEG